jgi:subtilisin family serine protease
MGCALAVLLGCASGRGGAAAGPVAAEPASGARALDPASGRALDPANAPAEPDAPASRPRPTRRLMVMLAPAPLPLWARTTRELEHDYDLRSSLSWTLASLGERCIVFEIRSSGRSAEDVVRRLTRDPRVRSAEPIQVFETLGDAAPRSDPYSHLQRGAHAIGLDQAHRWATGKGVRVAVIDTGVDVAHPDLRGRIVKAGNFVDRGEETFANDIHGTAVAGVLAAAAGNEVGIAGTAPEAELFALKACWPQPPGSRRAICDSYTLAKAIDFAIVEHAQVLNFSLSGPPDPILGRMLKAALERGITVVAAAADGKAPGFPASLEGVIAVLESDQDGNLRSPPFRYHAPMLAAPGVDILTTVPHGSYDFFTGSSLSAAAVSGIAALLLERNARLTPAQIGAMIHKTARPARTVAGEPDPMISLVDACAALGQVISGVTCPPAGRG